MESIGKQGRISILKGKKTPMSTTEKAAEENGDDYYYNGHDSTQSRNTQLTSNAKKTFSTSTSEYTTQNGYYYSGQKFTKMVNEASFNLKRKIAPLSTTETATDEYGNDYNYSGHESTFYNPQSTSFTDTNSEKYSARGTTMKSRSMSNEDIDPASRSKTKNKIFHHRRHHLIIQPIGPKSGLNQGVGHVQIKSSVASSLSTSEKSNDLDRNAIQEAGDDYSSNNQEHTKNFLHQNHHLSVIPIIHHNNLHNTANSTEKIKKSEVPKVKDLIEYGEDYKSEKEIKPTQHQTHEIKFVQYQHAQTIKDQDFKRGFISTSLSTPLKFTHTDGIQ